MRSAPVLSSHESMKDGLNNLLDELHKWAEALKTLRPDEAAEGEPVRRVA